MEGKRRYIIKHTTSPDRPGCQSTSMLTSSRKNNESEKQIDLSIEMSTILILEFSRVLGFFLRAAAVAAAVKGE